MLEMIKELCSLPGISGREEKVREYYNISTTKKKTVSEKKETKKEE